MQSEGLVIVSADTNNKAFGLTLEKGEMKVAVKVSCCV